MSSNPLKPIFEACRKVFKPTPEELAEYERQEYIRQRSTDLDLAVRGFKLGDISEADRDAALFAFGGLYGVVATPPRPTVPLTEVQQEFHISQASEDLLKEGVSQDQIDGIIAHAKDCMENPKPTWFGYLER